MKSLRSSLSDVYFTPLQIFLLFLLLGRFTLAIIILLLGFRMEKDFMRSTTVAIFIPMTFAELFNIYSEVVAYMNLFSETEHGHVDFATQIHWSTRRCLLYVIYDYVHYNVLVMMILLMYCCRLAYQAEEKIRAFPLNTLCLVAQIIPFFLSVLYYVSDGTVDTTLRILSVASRVVMIVCFTVITVQVIMVSSVERMRATRLLPYTHANSTDMQLRDARSRQAWTLVYLVLPYLAFIPFLVDAFAWLIAFNNPTDKSTRVVMSICEMIEFIIHFHRPLWMSVITVAFLPPYRDNFFNSNKRLCLCGPCFPFFLYCLNRN
ncbi:unnamed protein product [Heligmosomoides polygyrus]|uniref:G protein-coupled receptor n=1 Tax=Heligmosomoides polygyrus TaxID=6339 RepID=A0A3P8BGJ7_HELPZ|nr:unnamed protein product [Heligmosomoides polygyrus]